MAGADYKSCNVCGGKTFYDACLEYNPPTPEMLSEKKYDFWLHGVGDWAVICSECAKTHEVIVRMRS